MFSLKALATRTTTWLRGRRETAALTEYQRLQEKIARLAVKYKEIARKYPYLCHELARSELFTLRKEILRFKCSMERKNILLAQWTGLDQISRPITIITE